MGSWSVYCGISQIAITSGDECVLLPLKKNNNHGVYSPYVPATLPIFGKYDDYGGVEDIEENANTKLIETHFGISILDFTKLFTDWKAYECEECREIIDRCKNFDEIENWNFMFINRKVYDFMSTYLNDDVKGHLDFGNKQLLELIGFKYIGKVPDVIPGSDRFSQEWEFDGKKFYSDGNWLRFYDHKSKRNQGIYFFKGGYSDECTLTKYVNIPEDKMWIGDKAMWQLWKIFDKPKQQESLGWIIGERYSDMFMFDDNEEFTGILKQLGQNGLLAVQDSYRDKALKKLEEKYKKLSNLYFKNIKDFGDGLADLVTIMHNFNCMSGYFTPFVKYQTPQWGEHRNHQVLLDKFAEINKELCNKYNEDDE